MSEELLGVIFAVIYFIDLGITAGEAAAAISSMMSDMEKHPETANVAAQLAPLAMMHAIRGDLGEVRRFIEGFN